MSTRYYNPEVGRFLNADVFATTGQGLLGNNMFVYCNNNPANFQDSTGSKMVYMRADAPAPAGFPSPSAVSQTSISGGSGGSSTREFKEFVTNTDEQKVLDAKFAAFYKGRFVIKVPGASAGFSCGIMFIGNEAKSAATVKHEYGHTKQLDELGLPTYLGTVVVPSVICYALTELEVIDRKYYFSFPWERKADELGQTTDTYMPGSKEISDAYFAGTKLISCLFR